MQTKIVEQKLIINIVKMIIASVSLLVAAYAWFVYGETADVNPMSVTTTAHNEVLISLNDGATWSNHAVLNIPTDFTFSNEITGSGLDLYKPLTRNSAGEPLTLSSALAGRDYYEFDIMFKSSVDTMLYLDNTSYVKPLAGITEALLIGTSVTNKSVEGDFSRDLIAGSVRVAFIEHTYADETFTLGTSTNLVWAPNKSYEITETSEEVTASITSTNVQDYKYINVVSGSPSGEGLPVNLKDFISADESSNNMGGDPQVSYVNNIIDGKRISKVTVRIWAEGNDRDALTAVKGGQFAIKLSFVGANKIIDNVEPSVTSDLVLNKLIGFDSTMEYSIDYGTNWTTYATTSDPIFDEGATVYVRKSETTSNYASIKKVINY